MNITWKTIPVVLLVVAGVGFKAYNSTPHWKSLEDSQTTVPAGQLYVYMVEPKKKTVKFRVTGVTPGKPIWVYAVTEAQHKALQEGIAPEDKDIHWLFREEGGDGPRKKTFELKRGKHFIYFFPLEGDTETKLIVKVEYYHG